MPWKVFAEDSGTGLQDQSDHDFGDGAHFTALAHNPNSEQFAPSPPSLTTDYTVPETTLSEAQYRLRATSVEERDHDGDGITVTWPEVTFAVYAPQTTVSLTDNDVNYIYVSADLTTTGDDAQYVVNTTGSAPAEPSMKVAEVDTSNNSGTVVNQNPTGTYDTLTTNSVSNNDYHETVDSASVSGTVGLDLSVSNTFDRTLTGDTTFTFDNPSGTPAGNSFSLVVQQDGTGGRTITWPSSVQWDSGSAPSLTTNANDKHMLSFVSLDGGTTWIGLVAAQEIA